MEFEKFLDNMLGCVMTKKGAEEVKNVIKSNMQECGFDFATTKLEGQVFQEDKNHEPRIEISSEGYDDGEIIFVDYHLD